MKQNNIKIYGHRQKVLNLKEKWKKVGCLLFFFF